MMLFQTEKKLNVYLSSSGVMCSGVVSSVTNYPVGNIDHRCVHKIGRTPVSVQCQRYSRSTMSVNISKCYTIGPQKTWTLCTKHKIYKPNYNGAKQTLSSGLNYAIISQSNLYQPNTQLTPNNSSYRVTTGQPNERPAKRPQVMITRKLINSGDKTGRGHARTFDILCTCTTAI